MSMWHISMPFRQRCCVFSDYPPAMPCTTTDPEPHRRPERTRNTENVSRRGGARRTASLTEGDELMRLTITLTIKKLILQFIVKSRNRHSAK